MHLSPGHFLPTDCCWEQLSGIHFALLTPTRSLDIFSTFRSDGINLKHTKQYQGFAYIFYFVNPTVSLFSLIDFSVIGS